MWIVYKSNMYWLIHAWHNIGILPICKPQAIALQNPIYQPCQLDSTQDLLCNNEHTSSTGSVV